MCESLLILSRHTLHNPGRPITLTLSGLEITAFSISGLATYVQIPAFDACFDLGHCSVEASHLRNVLLTHSHQDHSGGVYRHLSLREMTGARPSRIVLPDESADDLAGLIHAYNRFERVPERDLTAIVRGVRDGDQFDLSGRYQVTVFDVIHRVPSRGFTVTERRRKLKETYTGLSGEAIHAARLRGEEVHDVHLIQRFTYIGDSTMATLERHPEVGRSDVLFFEITHLPGTPKERSEKYGHTHLDDFIDFARAQPDVLAHPQIVLKHFSMKYEHDEIQRALDVLPDEMRSRVTLLV